MRFKALAVAAALAAGAALAPQMASAAALPGTKAVQSQLAVGSSLVDEVRRRRWHRPHRFGRCSQVRRSCAYRFGWGTFGYRRCVVRRGC